MSIEEQLRQALAQKADSVTPRADALERITDRVNGVVLTEGTVTQLPRPRPIVRYVAMAAASIAVVGMLGYFLTQRPTTSVDLAVPPSTTSQVTQPPQTTEPVTSATPTTVMVARPEPPRGPVGSTKTEAAEKFLTLAGITSPHQVGETSGGAIVSRPDGTAVVELAMVAVEGGWAVSGAYSEGVSAYTDPAPEPGESVLAIRGEGRGFEATLNLRLISALDGSYLGGDYTNAGMPDPLPYEAELAVVGSESAWVIVSGDGGGEDVLQEFAAVPVVYEAKPDPRDFGVFRIANSDADEGLNIRTAAGIDNTSVIATLAAGTTGIRRTATLPVLVDDSIWWEVRTADGMTGWAHSSFLTNVDESISDETLLGIGENFLTAARQETFWMFPFQPWSTRVPIAFAWIGDLDNQAFRFDGADFREGAVWGLDSYRDWAVPAETYGQSTIRSTHWDFLGLREATDPQVEVGEGIYAYGFESSMIESYLPNVASVVISDQNPTGIWRAVHLFVEPTPAGPQIVAIGVSIQVP